MWGIAGQSKSFGVYSEMRNHWRVSKRKVTQPNFYFNGITLAVRLRIDRIGQGDSEETTAAVQARNNGRLAWKIVIMLRSGLPSWLMDQRINTTFWCFLHMRRTVGEEGFSSLSPPHCSLLLRQKKANVIGKSLIFPRTCFTNGQRLTLSAEQNQSRMFPSLEGCC